MGCDLLAQIREWGSIRWGWDVLSVGVIIIVFLSAVQISESRWHVVLYIIYFNIGESGREVRGLRKSAVFKHGQRGGAGDSRSAGELVRRSLRLFTNEEPSPCYQTLAPSIRGG